MDIDWQSLFTDQNNEVSINGYSSSSESEFTNYLQSDFTEAIDFYCGKLAVDEIINNVEETGFKTDILEDLLTKEISYSDWGEYFAYHQLENHHNITIPWPPSWDKRTKKASLPGADIVGFKKIDEKTTFVFGEVKTSSQNKYPPDVVIKSKNGLYVQIRELSLNSKINQLIGWLLLRSIDKNWENDFREALEHYFTKKRYIIIGVLIRDTKPDMNDLKQALKKLADLELPTFLYGYYTPLKIAKCMKLCLGGGDRNAAT